MRYEEGHGSEGMALEPGGKEGRRWLVLVLLGWLLSSLETLPAMRWWCWCEDSSLPHATFLFPNSVEM